MEEQLDTRSRTDEAGQSTAVTGTWTAIGLVVVIALALLVQWLTTTIPEVTEGTWFGPLAKPIEFPVYAIIVGFAFNGILGALGIRDRMSAAFRTEFYIKVGLVLLGATVNINVILGAALPSIVQALLLITTVFFFTWWFAGVLGLGPQLRALLASALSICGVSAAVATAGAVHARKEQLAYTAGLVIVFALPSIFLLPWLANVFGLSPAVAGAWIGGNIDTTAAVTAAGTIAGDEVLQYASVVKLTQNALIGVVAVALSIYFTLKIEPAARGGDGAATNAATNAASTGRAPARSRWSEVWVRFPKFVLGFIAASIVVSVLAAVIPEGSAAADQIETGLDASKWLQTIFFTLAFVSIGLEFRAGTLRDAGWKPVIVFLGGTLVNLVVGLALAWVLFGWLFAGLLA